MPTGTPKKKPSRHHVHCSHCGAPHPLTKKMITAGPPYKFLCRNCGKKTTAWTFRSLIDSIIEIINELFEDDEAVQTEILNTASGFDLPGGITSASVNNFISLCCVKLSRKVLAGQYEQAKIDDIMSIANNQLSTNMMKAMEEILLVLESE